MQAIVIARPGGPEVLEVRDVPSPEPGPGDVRVCVRAFALNRADLLQRRGMYPAPPDAPQDIPGMEYAGEVDLVGPDVRDVKVGDRVMGIVGGGSYAEQVIAVAAQTIPVPAGMSFEDATAIPEAYLTAFDALEQLRVVAGEWVLVHAIGSGVGTAALQLIRARGAKCVGTSRTKEKLDRATALGLDAGIDTSVEELVPAVRKITGRGAHAAIDLIGGAGFGDTLKSLALRGRVIVVGLTAGRKAEVDLGLVLNQRLHVIGTTLRSRSRAEKSALTQAFAAQALPFIADHRALPVVDRVFAFEEVQDAHAYMETNANFGKVVVRAP